jgi:STE24 endopeptidase
MGLVTSLFGFWVLSILIGWEPLYAAFRAGPPAPHKALVIVSLFASHFTFFLKAVTNAISRRYEYASDRFSVQVVKDPEAMASSLVALSRENLSNLTPHPLYSFYHYTHPTTLERVRAIQQTA